MHHSTIEQSVDLRSVPWFWKRSFMATLLTVRKIQQGSHILKILLLCMGDSCKEGATKLYFLLRNRMHFVCRYIAAFFDNTVNYRHVLITIDLTFSSSKNNFCQGQIFLSTFQKDVNTI